MSDQRFRPEHHIRRGADFARAFRRRWTAADQWLIVFGEPNGLPHPRLGLSVSRKVGGAVVRNRWKRLLREAFRLQKGQLPVGWDFIIVPKARVEPTLAALYDSLGQLARRIARRRNAPTDGRSRP